MILKLDPPSSHTRAVHSRIVVYGAFLGIVIGSNISVIEKIRLVQDVFPHITDLRRLLQNSGRADMYNRLQNDEISLDGLQNQLMTLLAQCYSDTSSYPEGESSSLDDLHKSISTLSDMVDNFAHFDG
jgi:hypothetical protein